MLKHLLFLTILITLFSPTTSAAVVVETFTVESVSLKIYRDGVVLANQVFLVNETMPSITTTLFAHSVGNILALDSQEVPLPYEVAPPSITITTLGSTRVTLQYQTSSMTKKEADTWTFTGEIPYNHTITLPEQAAPIYVSQPPLDMVSKDGIVTLSMPPGSSEVSYVLALTIPTSTPTITTSTTSQTSVTSSTSQTTSTSPGQPLTMEVVYGGIVVAAVVVVAGVILIFGRRRGIGGELELKPEDKQVLDYISERGGRVSETELREKFLLPKTSMWRLVKRLERMGLVRVKRVGLQNEVEIIK